MPIRIAITALKLATEAGKAKTNDSPAVKPKIAHVKAGTPLNLSPQVAAELEAQGAVVKPGDRRASRFGYGPGQEGKARASEELVTEAGADARDLGEDRESLRRPARGLEAPVDAFEDERERGDGFQRLEADEDRANEAGDGKSVSVSEGASPLDRIDSHKGIEAFVKEHGIVVPEAFAQMKFADKKAAVKEALDAGQGEGHGLV